MNEETYVVEMRETLVELFELREEETASRHVDGDDDFVFAFCEFLREVLKHAKGEFLRFDESSFGLNE